MPKKTDLQNEDVFDADKQVKLERVHEAISHPDKFSEVFCAAIEKQVDMRKSIQDILIELLKTNSDARGSIKEIIIKIEKGEFKSWLKKFGISVWTAIVFIFGSVVTILVSKFIS